MKGDFSRNTFNPKKRYSSVRMQQGRVQLDADWNEQMDLIEHRHRTEAIDFIGATGAPSKNAGFAISVVDDSGTKNNLKISAGRYYVNGILCENFADVNFTAQEDYPSAVLPKVDGTYLVYLETWQHNISGVDDPSIYEAALNGADTTVRTKTLAQVKLLSLGDSSNASIPADLNSYLSTQFISQKGKLTAKVDAVVANLQNQLYRIEIHQSNENNQIPSFKWSRNNAAIGARITNIQTSENNSAIISLDLSTQLKQLNLSIGQWLEIITDEQQLRNEPGILVKLDTIEDYNLTVSGSINVDVKSLTNSILRCWDMTNTSGVIAITSDIAIALEDGLQVQFTAAGNYKTGDYWLIPTRVGNQIEWLIDANNQPAAQAPFGIERNYAALAIVNCSNNQWSLHTDARYIFTSLADLQHSNAISIDPKAPAGSLSIDDHGNIKFKGNLATDAIPGIAPFYIKGTGSNQKAGSIYTLIKIRDKVVIDSRNDQKPRGLYLCIIDKTDYSCKVVLYDIYINNGTDNPNGNKNAEGLAAALNAMTSQQIGVLASIDAWEAWQTQANSDLINAFQRVGLYRAAAIKNYSNVLRQPYVAIFTISDQIESPAKVIEVLQSSSDTASFAEISGWLFDNSFIASSNGADNTLSYYSDASPAIVINENNNIVPQGAFSTTPAPNKVPIADSSGHIDSKWLGDSISPTSYFSVTPTPNKVPMANNSGHIDPNWIGNFWLTAKDGIGQMNTARSRFCAVYLNGKIYALGGADGNNQALSSVEVYDLNTNKWTPATNLITPRKSFAACAFDGKIYIFGGQSNSDWLDTIEIYNPQNSSEPQPPKLTCSKRIQLSATLFNDTIYIIGGFDDSSKYTNLVEVYKPYADFNNKHLNTASNLNKSRCDHCSVLLNGKIYVLGGWNGDDAKSDASTYSSKIIEVYDSSSNKWDQFNLNLNHPTRRYFGAAVVNGKIYAIGGSDNSVEVFDPLNNQLGTVVSNMPTWRQGLAAVSVGNRIYTIGGNTTTTVEVYVCGL